MSHPSSLTIGDLKASLGKLVCGYLKAIELSDRSEVKLPLMVLAGEKGGPTLLLTAAVHGQEIVGIEVIRRLLREELNPRQLKGTVVAIPVANPLAFQYSSRFTSTDHVNLNRVFPGSISGSPTQRIAHAVFEVAKKSDYVVDLHCAPLSICHTIVNLGSAPTEKVGEKSLEMAKAFGATVTFHAEKGLSGSLTGTTVANGIPSMTVEFGDWRIWTEASVQGGLLGVLNIMKKIGMIAGTVKPQKGFPIIKEPLYVRRGVADVSGIVHLTRTPGDRIKKGDVLARILDYFGNEVGRTLAVDDGYLIGYPLMENQAVGTGDLIIFTGHKSLEGQLLQW